MTSTSQVAGEVDALLAEVDPRAAPLIVTIFGDSIVPRGGNVWLGSLISLMACFGISERLVRTGVFRLSKDGWFQTRTSGRRSFYELTPESAKTFAEADARIYSTGAADWDGRWTLVQAPPNLPAKFRQKLRENLKWSGYGQLSPTLMISPRPPEPALIDSLADIEPVVFRARLDDIAGAQSPAEVAKSAWDLAELSAAYTAFTKRFKPFGNKPPDTPEPCFVLRTLAIHEFRRILLKDPQLPAELTSQAWPGVSARDLAAKIYRATTPATEEFLTKHLECWDGLCLEPGPTYAQRFA